MNCYRFLVLIPLVFFGCAYSNPKPSPSVVLHKIPDNLSDYDIWYTTMANKGARGGNPPRYQKAPVWAQPIDGFTEMPM